MSITKSILRILMLLISVFSIGNTFAAPKNSVLEVVVFHSKPSVYSGVVVAAATEVMPFLHSMPGFISRTFAQGEKSHEWIDILRWKSVQSAKFAANSAQSDPKMLNFISLMSDFNMQHYFVISSG